MLDVAIVGAGPGGAWAACQLARRGLAVAIFDGSHPREKPCGGGVTGRALALVAGALDGTGGGRPAWTGVAVRSARFLDTSDTSDPSATSATSDTERHREATVHLADAAAHDAALTVVDRRRFDAALLQAAQAAGARFIAERVVDVGVDREGATIRTRHDVHRARWVIGADGPNSLVRRRLATPMPRAHLSIATGFYAHGVTADEIALEFVGNPPGYLWSFPRHDHLAIGICTQADEATTAGALRQQADAWIRRARLADTARLEPYSWPIPSLPAGAWRSAPLGGAGWLLVGDAAGLVDPITREGIFFALQSAHLAAAALTQAPGAAHRQYERDVRADIVPELQRAAELKSGFFQPRFARLVIDALAHSAAIRSVMADLVAGTQPYRTLKRRLLATGEIGLAWRVLSDRWRGSHRGRALAPAAD